MPLKAPYNNQNIKQWRDKPEAIDSADFDPTAIEENKETE